MGELKNKIMNYNMMINQLIVSHHIPSDIAQVAFECDRVHFVPIKYRDKSAYQDRLLHFNKYDFILAPSTQLLLIHKCDIKDNDSVLEIGCSSGYATVVMSKLGANILALEKNYKLVSITEENLSRFEIDNSVVIEMLYKDGYAKNAPYNIILINGAIHEVPQVFIDQLAVGGRLVTLIKNENFTYGLKITKTSLTQFSEEKFYNVSAELFNL